MGGGAFPPPPSGHRAGEPPFDRVFEIASTAEIQPGASVEVCVGLGDSPEPAEVLHLFELGRGTDEDDEGIWRWRRLPARRDGERLCGMTDRLGVFALLAGQP